MRGGQKKGQLFGDTGVVLRVTPGADGGIFRWYHAKRLA